MEWEKYLNGPIKDFEEADIASIILDKEIAKANNEKDIRRAIKQYIISITNNFYAREYIPSFKMLYERLATDSGKKMFMALKKQLDKDIYSDRANAIYLLELSKGYDSLV